MKINDIECLPVIECDANGEGLLLLDKGAAMRLMNGTTIRAQRVVAEFTYSQRDDKGKYSTKTVAGYITSFKIGLLKETVPE